MALDGVTVSCIADELQVLVDGRVDKIYMPEKDEVVLAVRSRGSNHRLLLTSNSSHPRAHFTQATKENPMQPPLFCMVLRKHLSGGRITSVIQPDFERILEIHVESRDEMGDLSVKRLIIELMGKHSNIILVGETGILDSAKRITREISSVREILPGGMYVPPPSDKHNPLLLDYAEFIRSVCARVNVHESIYGSYSGISPMTASELCERAGVPADTRGECLSEDQQRRLYTAFESLMNDVRTGRYAPQVLLDAQGRPTEFSALAITRTGTKLSFTSMSALLEYYYAEKDRLYRTAQKTADLRKLVRQAIERASRKKDVHVRTLREIKQRDTLRCWGELLTANIYALEQGMTSFTTQNYYDERLSEVTIPLDASLTPVENAQRYFERYNKQKRTYAAVCEQMRQTDTELEYLEAVMTMLSVCADEADIDEVREELAEQGILKKRRVAKRDNRRRAKPLAFVTEDGFEIYVGKNNRQNDELTLKLADNTDIWFHTKDIPGAHVIVRTNGREPSDTVLGEAARLAAYYSKARNGSQVPVDYTYRKHVKKPSGAKPGMVIYTNHKTAYVTPTERGTSRPIAK